MPAADRLSSYADAFRLRLLRSPLPGWWQAVQDDLLSLLPARWRALVAGQHRQLWLLPEGDELALVLAGPDGARPLGRVPREPGVLQELHARIEATGTAAWLLLPEGTGLRRRLSLPAAAEPRLREVLGFELDRQTPFSADQVVYEGRVLARDPASQTLQAELVVLPRARLDAALQSLGPLAAGLEGVDLREGDRRLGLDLLAGAGHGRRRDPVRRMNSWLLAGGAVALVLAMLVVLGNREARLAGLRAEVAAAEEQVRDVRRVRNQLAASAQAANFLSQRRAAQPTMLELIQDLSDRIPDDTSLDKLAVNQGRVVMVGQSRAAPALVGLLQASPLLSEPALSGAVQADPRSGRDRFTLTAQLRAPEAADGAPR